MNLKQLACLMLLLATVAIAQTTNPANDSARSAFDAFFAAAKAKDAKKVEGMIVKIETHIGPEHWREMLSAVEMGFFEKLDIARHVVKAFDDCAAFVVEFRSSNLPGGGETETVYLMRIGQEWKVLFLQDDFQQAGDLKDDQKKRLAELRKWSEEQLRSRRLARRNDEQAAKADRDRLRLQSGLNVAVFKEDLEEIKKAITAGADPARRGGSGEYPIAIAATRETSKTLKYLIEIGVDVNPAMTFKQPLMEAIKAKREENAKLLIEAGAKLDYIDNEQQSPLLMATMNGMNGVVKIMLDKGVKPNDQMLMLPLLHAAAASGDYETFSLIKPLYPDLTLKNRYGGTAMHFASTLLFAAWRKDSPRDQGKIAEELLKAGCDPRAIMRSPWTDRDMATPLPMAAHANLSEVVNMLVKNVKYEQAELNLALAHAAQYASPEVIQTLLEAGASVKDIGKNETFRTPLHDAIWSRNPEKVRLLLDAGHPVDVAIKPLNRTPLHQAVVQGTTELVQLLLDRGADLALKDADGNDALALIRIRLEKGREYRNTGEVRYHPEVRDAPDEGKKIESLLRERLK